MYRLGDVWGQRSEGVTGLGEVPETGCHTHEEKN